MRDVYPAAKLLAWLEAATPMVDDLVDLKITLRTTLKDSKKSNTVNIARCSQESFRAGGSCMWPRISLGFGQIAFSGGLRSPV